MSFLPVELIDVIICYSGDDIATLRSCSLVCQTWRYRAQHVLFSSIQISADDGGGQVASLQALFDAAPRLYRAVKSLLICGGTLSDINLHLPNLVKLTLKNVSIPMDAQSRTHSVARGVTILRLIKCTFTSFPAFFAYLLSFGRLEELHLDDVHWDKQTPRIPDAILRAPPLALRTLSTRSLGHPEFYTALTLRDYVDVCALQHLEYAENIDRTDGIPAAALIGRCVLLRELRLRLEEREFQCCLSTCEFITAIDFAALAELHTLKLDIEANNDLPFHLDAVACLCASLGVLPQPRALAVEIDVYSESHFWVRFPDCMKQIVSMSDAELDAFAAEWRTGVPDIPPLEGLAVYAHPVGWWHPGVRPLWLA